MGRKAASCRRRLRELQKRPKHTAEDKRRLDAECAELMAQVRAREKEAERRELERRELEKWRRVEEAALHGCTCSQQDSRAEASSIATADENDVLGKRRCAEKVTMHGCISQQDSSTAESKIGTGEQDVYGREHLQDSTPLEVPTALVPECSQGGMEQPQREANRARDWALASEKAAVEMAATMLELGYSSQDVLGMEVQQICDRHIHEATARIFRRMQRRRKYKQKKQRGMELD